MKKTLFCFLFLSIMGMQLAYTQSMMHQMIDYTLKELASLKPEDQNDEVRSNTPQPLDYNKWLAGADMAKSLDKKSKEIKLKIVNNGAAVIDDKEYPDIEMELMVDYTDFPLCQTTGAYWDATNIQDKKGNNLLLTGKRFDEYVELGIIDNDYFTMPGEWSQKYWLASEPQSGDTLIIKGTASLNYPLAAESILLDSSVAGQTFELGGVKFTLMSIEKNTIKYMQEGRRDSAGKIQSMFLNKDNAAFGGMTSTGMSKEIYNVFLKYGEQVPKEVKDKIVAAIDPQENYQEMLYVVQLTGNVKKVIFYKPKGNKVIELPFTVKKTWSFSED